MNLAEKSINFEIRLIRGDEEIQACAQWMASTEPWSLFGITEEMARSRISDPPRECWVAEMDGQLAGFTVLRMDGPFAGYIQTLLVAPSWRSRGLGRKLLAQAEERIFRDWPNVFMCVTSFNREAARLYARLGYEVVGALSDYIVRGHDEILLRKSREPLRDFWRKRA
jgi:ribosomal protein S18 acetylase RimI-like enzyme